MEWDEETIWRIRTLWAEGHSTAEIGRRLGVSKNAVVGKAHRLNLPARPSPIRRGVAEPVVRPSALRRIIGPTLPPLPGPVGHTPFAASPPGTESAPERARVDQRPLPTVAQAPLTQAPGPQVSGAQAPGPQVSGQPRPQPARVAVAPIESPVAARAVPPLRPVAAPRASRRVSACCWPIGEPGKPSFRFCDGEAMSGKPYCSEHAQLAYVKIRDRREEAA